MSYESTKLTNSGRWALAAALSGENLTYTKIVMGDGYIPEGVSAESMTDVASRIETLDIIKLATGRTPGTAIVGGMFTNKDRQNGFYFRELGLYASTPTTGEVLYSYVNAGDLAEYIPEGGGAKVVEKHIDCVTLIDNTERVTAVLASGTYASLEQVQNAADGAEQAQQTADEALEIANGVKEITDSLNFADGKCKWVVELEARVKRLEDALFKNLADNSFAVSFSTISDKTITSGNWNERAGRMET